MSQVVAFVPDLLFGSNVVGSLRAAGHEPVLAGDPEAMARELARAEVLIVDLTSDASDRIDQVRAARPFAAKTLGFYSHVETDVRERAQQAGFDLVVPRSRMAREGGALVAQLLAGGD